MLDNTNGIDFDTSLELSRNGMKEKHRKTISLCSAPFYTSRFGYKMCLWLYLNGDGAGKGTHLSFFLTIMRGEYDALLSWPFQQMVTLMLLDQDKRKNIVQAFRPEPSSSSFWQPKTEKWTLLRAVPSLPLSPSLTNLAMLEAMLMLSFSPAVLGKRCACDRIWMVMVLGKATHLSFFLTIMRREYDVLLSQPF